jgi:hypothetical protein
MLPCASIQTRAKVKGEGRRRRPAQSLGIEMRCTIRLPSHRALFAESFPSDVWYMYAGWKAVAEHRDTHRSYSMGLNMWDVRQRHSAHTITNAKSHSPHCIHCIQDTASNVPDGVTLSCIHGCDKMHKAEPHIIFPLLCTPFFYLPRFQVCGDI